MILICVCLDLHAHSFDFNLLFIFVACYGQQVKNLLKKRLPVIVRLIHGMPPKGLKSSSFVPEFRLLGFIEVENNIFALPLQKDIELISIPLNTKLKMQCVKNIAQLENFTEFKRLVERSMRHLQDVKSRLQVIDLKLYDRDGSNKKESVLITESKSIYIFYLIN